MHPGTIVDTITSHSGRKLVVRYPKIEDVVSLTHYINEISREDTYLTFSGEQITENEERHYIEYSLQSIQAQNKVLLFVCDGEKIVGTSHVERSLRSRTRELHVGFFGISLARAYRGDGIGRQLALVIFEEARKNIPGLRQIRLDLYAENKPALRLYEKLGFTIVGRIPEGISYKNRFVDKLIMVLPINEK